MSEMIICSSWFILYVCSSCQCSDTRGVYLHLVLIIQLDFRRTLLFLHLDGLKDFFFICGCLGGRLFVHCRVSSMSRLRCIHFRECGLICCRVSWMIAAWARCCLPSWCRSFLSQFAHRQRHSCYIPKGYWSTIFCQQHYRHLIDEHQGKRFYQRQRYVFRSWFR